MALGNRFHAKYEGEGRDYEYTQLANTNVVVSVVLGGKAGG